MLARSVTRVIIHTGHDIVKHTVRPNLITCVYRLYHFYPYIVHLFYSSLLTRSTFSVTSLFSTFFAPFKNLGRGIKMI